MKARQVQPDHGLCSVDHDQAVLISGEVKRIHREDAAGTIDGNPGRTPEIELGRNRLELTGDRVHADHRTARNALRVDRTTDDNLSVTLTGHTDRAPETFG